MNHSMRNGRYAMLLITEFIQQMSPTITLDEFCDKITAVIHREYIAHHLDIKQLAAHPEQRITASAVIYSAYHHEIWMVGDCQCMINGVLYENNKPAEAANAAKRSIYIKKALSNGMTVKDFQDHDTGRDHIINDIILSCQQQNVSYAVIDGFPIYHRGIRVLTFPSSATIILASDGYPTLKPTLAESEQSLHYLIENDPLCINICPATKGLMKGYLSFDDRTYVRAVWHN